jgi:hypothetical protein
VSSCNPSLQTGEDVKWYRLIFRVATLDYQWADEVADAIAAH